MVEIDTSKFAVDRYFMLAAGKEMGMTGAPYGADSKISGTQHGESQAVVHSHLGAAFK